jgi:hypothetical protein
MSDEIAPFLTLFKDIFITTEFFLRPWMNPVFQCQESALGMDGESLASWR